MPATIINPPDLFSSPAFSHGVSKVGRPLYIAGQLPLSADGACVGEGDITAQVDRVWFQISRILEEAGIGLPSYYEWRTRSGCYFCFYQQVGEWQGLKERHPDLFEAAKAYEAPKANGRVFTWTQTRSLNELEQIPERYPSPVGEPDDGCAICHL
jgi:hypothetical protein